MNPLPVAITWIPLDVLARLTLALGVGLLVGLEREWRGKEAGLRTFALISLLGALGGLLGASYALVNLALLGVLIVFLNLQGMRSNEGTELTTSAAILVTSLMGVLCGLGHRVTPVAVSVVTAGLLSWKERLAEFGHKLTAAELRSAILLGILAFAIYPVLPVHPIDHWGSHRSTGGLAHRAPDRWHRFRELHPMETVRDARGRISGISGWPRQ